MHLQKYSRIFLGISSTVTVHSSVICFRIVNSDGLIAIKQSACISADPSMDWNNWQFTTWCLYIILPKIATVFVGGLLWPFFRHFLGEMTVPKLNTWRKQLFSFMALRYHILWYCFMKHGEVKFRGVVVFPASLFEFQSLFLKTLQVIYTVLSTIKSMRTTSKVLCRSQKNSIKLEIESVKKA